MCELFQYPQQKKKLKLMYAKNGINNRYSVIPDLSLLKGIFTFKDKKLRCVNPVSFFLSCATLQD
jgi:hypothetical protein